MKPTEWIAKDRSILRDGRTSIMGVLNVTPDSFSDGGHFLDADRAVARAMEMVEQGVDIIDIGGESTRPGSDPVSADDELARVVPVIRKLSGRIKAAISIDTTKSVVAQAAMEAGAHIINDVSGFTLDPRMTEVARASGAGIVLMHMQGRPKSMQEAPHYQDVVSEVGRFLAGRVKDLQAGGFPEDRIVVDPGIGFGKTLEHNLDLLRYLPDFAAACGRPVLVGLSRKRWIGTITGKEVHDRLAGSLAAMAYAIQRGARIIRVHDVKESCDVARMIDTLSSNEGERCR